MQNKILIAFVVLCICLISCSSGKIGNKPVNPNASPETWKELVTEGTELNMQWKKQADNIAGYLKQLQEAKIPILWRPYHEMNGVWVWNFNC